jgi:hypothetical protein
MDGSGMDLTVVSRALEGETSLYKGVRGVEVSSDVTSRRLTTVLLDVERNEGRALVMLKVCQYR